GAGGRRGEHRTRGPLRPGPDGADRRAASRHAPAAGGMMLTTIAAAGGLGFVLVAIAVNVLQGQSGLPLPTAGGDPARVSATFEGAGPALRRSAVLAPLSWLCLTVFAAGLVALLWGTTPTA